MTEFTAGGRIRNQPKRGEDQSTSDLNLKLRETDWTGQILCEQSQIFYEFHKVLW